MDNIRKSLMMGLFVQDLTRCPTTIGGFLGWIFERKLKLNDVQTRLLFDEYLDAIIEEIDRHSQKEQPEENNLFNSFSLTNPFRNMEEEVSEDAFK